MNQKIVPEHEGFTLIELLITIAIIGILGGLSYPAFAKMKEKAEMVKHVANVKAMTMHTLRWSADNSQTLPSPIYPGGHNQDDPSIPEEWDFANTGSGLWLDGIIYYAAMFEAHNSRESEKENGGDKVEKVDGENGNHLKDTIFFSSQSFKNNQSEEDMHKHSYAMNKSLQLDFLYANSKNPQLTNKNLGRITHRPSAVLYIENENSNVIGFENRAEIIATGEKRWTSGKVIASFLDGSAFTLSNRDIPNESPQTDNESSKFWGGVDSHAYSGS